MKVPDHRNGDDAPELGRLLEILRRTSHEFFELAFGNVGARVGFQRLHSFVEGVFRRLDRRAVAASNIVCWIDQCLGPQRRHTISKSAVSQGMSKGFDFPMGQGDIQWNRVREELEKIGFRGWATAEVRGGDRRLLAEISEEMNKILGL